MLRPRIQQLPSRPVPAEPSGSNVPEVNLGADDTQSPGRSEAAPAAFRRVLCAGLFGLRPPASRPADGGEFVPLAVESGEG